jgi:hypothetical protein
VVAPLGIWDQRHQETERQPDSKTAGYAHRV